MSLDTAPTPEPSRFNYLSWTRRLLVKSAIVLVLLAMVGVPWRVWSDHRARADAARVVEYLETIKENREWNDEVTRKRVCGEARTAIRNHCSPFGEIPLRSGRGGIAVGRSPLVLDVFPEHSDRGASD